MELGFRWLNKQTGNIWNPYVMCTCEYLRNKWPALLQPGKTSVGLSVCPSIQAVCVDPSGQGRRLCRRVCLNRLQDVAVCWWNLGEPDELWPWTPIDVKRSNLVLLSCSPTDDLKVLKKKPKLLELYSFFCKDKGCKQLIWLYVQFYVV